MSGISPTSSVPAAAGPTRELYLEDAYLREIDARVIAVDEQGIQLDRTVFYATGGGQPGDAGWLATSNGERLAVATTVRDRADGAVRHILAEPGRLAPGDGVTAVVDWPLRYRHMRCHTALHLLCALIPYPVTGGSVRAGSGRLDFDIPQPLLSKEDLNERLAALVASNRRISTEWISAEELRARPELVRTLQVAPPVGEGPVRLVRIEGIDLQPCGGSHLASTGEVGAARVAKIEKKGRENRRVEIVLED